MKRKNSRFLQRCGRISFNFRRRGKLFHFSSCGYRRKYNEINKTCGFSVEYISKKAPLYYIFLGNVKRFPFSGQLCAVGSALWVLFQRLVFPALFWPQENTPGHLEKERGFRFLTTFPLKITLLFSNPFPHSPPSLLLFRAVFSSIYEFFSVCELNPWDLKNFAAGKGERVFGGKRRRNCRAFFSTTSFSHMRTVFR